MGGHQRLSALDSLMGKADYELDVIEVDLSEREELKLNVALNNTDMGRANTTSSIQLCKEFDIDPGERPCFFPKSSPLSSSRLRLFGRRIWSVPKKKFPRRKRKSTGPQGVTVRKSTASTTKEFGNYNIDELKGVLTVVFKSESDKRMFMSSHGLPEEKKGRLFRRP